MRLLLDTHIVLAIVGRRTKLLPGAYSSIPELKSEMFISVASIWEVAIKARLGKLDIGMKVDDFPEACSANNLETLPIETRHVVAELRPTVSTRDPFDRLLLAQCQVEALRLVTLDEALRVHPLVWQPVS